MSTTYEKKRREAMDRYMNNVNDDGRYGRIFELECASKYSKKTRVSVQGKADIFIHYEKGHYAAECKTNGGRIGALRKSNAPKFVIYQLDFVYKRKATKSKEAWEEIRHIDPVLIPTKIFLDALDRFKATKSTNGDHPEEAIQPSSKKFYEWLLDWPIPFEPNLHYTADDFDGLE